MRAPEFDRKTMRQLVVGLETCSDKIRKLRSEYYTRGDVARFLKVRPQYVRNVEVYDARRQDRLRRAEATSSDTEGPSIKVKLDADGRLEVPLFLRDALEMKPGETLWLRIQDGELRLSTAKAVTRRIQAFFRSRIPEGVSLVEELFKERRREFEMEEREARGE